MFLWAFLLGLTSIALAPIVIVKLTYSTPQSRFFAANVASA